VKIDHKICPPVTKEMADINSKMENLERQYKQVVEDHTELKRKIDKNHKELSEEIPQKHAKLTQELTLNLRQEIIIDIKNEMKQGMDKLKQEITHEIMQQLSIKDETQLGIEKLEKILKDKESSANSNPPNTTNSQPSFLSTTNPQPNSPSITKPQPTKHNMSPNGLMIVNLPPPYTTQPIYMYLMRVKLELSKFDGDEKQSVAWINKEEEYFEIHNVQFNDEKVKYTSMQLDDIAFNWYMWWK
jgi:hypothetical protein